MRATVVVSVGGVPVARAMATVMAGESRAAVLSLSDQNGQQNDEKCLLKRMNPVLGAIDEP